MILRDSDGRECRSFSAFWGLFSAKGPLCHAFWRSGANAAGGACGSASSRLRVCVYIYIYIYVSVCGSCPVGEFYSNISQPSQLFYYVPVDEPSVGAQGCNSAADEQMSQWPVRTRNEHCPAGATCKCSPGPGSCLVPLPISIHAPPSPTHREVLIPTFDQSSTCVFPAQECVHHAWSAHACSPATDLTRRLVCGPQGYVHSSPLFTQL